MTALDGNDLAAMTKWLDAGGDLHSRADNGETLLHKAAHRGHLNIAKELLRRGIPVNAVDKGGYSLLHEAARGGRFEMAAWLMEMGVDTELRNSGGNSAQDMAKEKHPELAEMIGNGGLRPRWLLTGDNEVTRISPKADIGYRLTEIFNFAAKNYVVIARNMKTGGEAVTMKTYGEFGDGELIEAAEDEFTRLGGKFPDGYQTRKLEKPSRLPGRRLG